MVVAFLALLIALGGTSYAVTKLPKNSVGSTQIKRNAVNGTKVKDNSLSGKDIKEAALGPVPSALVATNANHAAAADHAGAAAAIDRLVYRSAAGSIPPAPDTTSSSVGFATASCDTGLHAVGGGVQVGDTDANAVVDSYPSSATSWSAHVDNSSTTAGGSFTVYVICVASGVG